MFDVETLHDFSAIGRTELLEKCATLESNSNERVAMTGRMLTAMLPTLFEFLDLEIKRDRPDETMKDFVEALACATGNLASNAINICVAGFEPSQAKFLFLCGTMAVIEANAQGVLCKYRDHANSPIAATHKAPGAVQ